MARAFAEIAFTPSVKAAQTRYGTRRSNQAFEEDVEREDELGELERAFIGERDGFYLATVSETGWPYVQFRGGPAGFLKVLDSRTLGFADFRGNVQYLSVGNLDADGRVAMILVDYAHQQRLKLWGRARVIPGVDDPALVKRLVVPGYQARVERAIVIAVEAFDWNCPQHITPRFTEAEVEAAVAPLKAELASLRARLMATQGEKHD
jgi:predicted pyridoxine 5'-phosphate oxidase superfamily flavin-nucleotide-binding protein